MAAAAGVVHTGLRGSAEDPSSGSRPGCGSPADPNAEDRLSTAEDQGAEQHHVPHLQEDEVSRLEQEDPEFAVVQAKARAKARGEPYNPAVHGPFERQLAPRLQKQVEEAQKNGNLQDVISRFMARAQPRLKLEPPERKDLA